MLLKVGSNVLYRCSSVLKQEQSNVCRVEEWQWEPRNYARLGVTKPLWEERMAVRSRETT